VRLDGGAGGRLGLAWLGFLFTDHRQCNLTVLSQARLFAVRWGSLALNLTVHHRYPIESTHQQNPQMKKKTEITHRKRNIEIHMVKKRKE
jgi:hypothetical protein